MRYQLLQDIKTQNGANHNKDKERSNGTKNEVINAMIYKAKSKI